MRPSKFGTESTRTLLLHNICLDTHNMKMSHKIVDLEQYIVKTRYPYGHKPHRGVFKSTPSNGRPTLQSDRPNRIIIFRGCFNPPHVAHEALLRFAYEQSKDMNIIAAIVYPVDESSVKYKCQHQEGGLVFTKQERVRLWGGDEPHEWRWVFDQEHYGFGQFLARLKNSIIQDGFELEYATLIGPDHVHPGYVPRWDDWGCSTIITGNSGREAGFLTPYGELLRMLGAEEWKFISTNRREEQKEVSQKDAVKQGQ